MEKKEEEEEEEEGEMRKEEEEERGGLSSRKKKQSSWQREVDWREQRIKRSRRGGCGGGLVPSPALGSGWSAGSLVAYVELML
jgi:hypothetical protein